MDDLTVASIDEAIEDAMIRSGKFYRHMDRSICCVKCGLTMREGCDHARVKVSICGHKFLVKK